MKKAKDNSLLDVLYQRAHLSPDEKAFLQLDSRLAVTKTILNRELFEKAKKIAAKICKVEFNPDRPVILFYSSRIEFIEGFFGCLLAKRLGTSVNLPSTLFYTKQIDRINRIMELTNANIGLHCTADKNDFDYIIEKNTNFRKLHWINTDHCNENEGFDFIAPKMDDPAIVQFTSGSTQNPRGVLLTHKNLASCLRNLVNDHGLNSKTKNVSWLPHFHDMGLITGYLLPFYCGGLSVQMPTLNYLRDPMSWLDGISKFGATYGICPNFALEKLIKLSHEIPKDLNLKQLKILGGGSEMNNPDVFDKFYEIYSKFGLQRGVMTAGYGLAEATLTIANGVYKKNEVIKLDRNALAKNRIKELKSAKREDRINVMSCGKLVHGMVVKVKKIKGEDIGEILVRGPSVIQSYWNNSSTESFVDIQDRGKKRKFFKTNDLGFLKKGRLYIVGRKDDVIKYNGDKIYNFDIAHHVATIDENINSSRIILCQNEKDLYLLVELSDLKKGLLLPSERDLNLKKKISDLLLKNFLFKPEIFFLPMGFLPTTSSGKVIRSLSIQKFLEQRSVLHSKK